MGKNRRNEWFSNKQLNDLQRVYEVYGYQTARVFLAGKNKNKENKTLLEAFDMIRKARLDLSVSSYVIGNLNNAIDMRLESEGGSQ